MTPRQAVEEESKTATSQGACKHERRARRWCAAVGGSRVTCCVVRTSVVVLCLAVYDVGRRWQ